MNKAELVSKLAEMTDIPKTQANKIFSALIDMLRTAIVNKEKVVLPGFGSFVYTERKARTGRNPRTGDELEIPAKTAVKFRPASSINTDLNPPAKKAAKPKPKQSTKTPAKPASKKAK